MKISVSSLSWIVLRALIVCAPAAASGATRQVPADFPTIQAAIDAAADGDTVLVAPGIYPETISFLGKAIALVSSGGAEVTTIDGGGNDVVVRFVAGEGPDSLLEGFTVTGGFNPAFDGDGGGIVCIGSSPAIEANIITANQTYWRGAGIFSDGGSPAITGNQIAGNSFVCIIADAPCGLGGGIYASGGQPVIARNIIAGNSAPDSGGAIYLAGATTALVEDNEIRANLGGTGGGVSCSGLSLVTLRNNLLVANEAVGFSTLAGPVDGFGGGLLCMGGSTVTMT
ncbi:MAG: right-handed parallel beta-helix repeat-containing protein, partial [Planctomycetota bacterium]